MGSARESQWPRVPVGLYGKRVIFDRITIEPEKTAREPDIRGLRIPVAKVADGMTTSEVIAGLPALEARGFGAGASVSRGRGVGRESPLRHPA